MTKIIAFTGSNSSTSINDQLLKFTLGLFETFEVEYIDLKALDVPIFSEDKESKSGTPEDIQHLRSKIDKADALVVAANEHNGTMSAFFKNITDWLSRTGSYLEDKTVFLLSTSPGAGAAKSSMDYTTTNFEKFGAHIDQKFSLPTFDEYFKNGELDKDYKLKLEALVQEFETNLKQN